MGYNSGIAHAQNEGLKFLDKQVFLWALTLIRYNCRTKFGFKICKIYEEYSKINEVAAIGTDIMILE
jgi:hypothetical protein